MKGVNSSMRLKLKGDVFFLPDQDGGVYFRNNECSFRMEGSSVQQWIEKLLPAFDGEHTLEELTDGLPDLYSHRVYEMANVLYNNGFVRDISQDIPHQLPDQVLRRYAPQIEFLDNLAGSGAFRFQTFRNMKVLAVGAYPMLASLIGALFEAGLPDVTMLITNAASTNRQRLDALAEHARKTDSAVDLKEIPFDPESLNSLRQTMQPFDAVLYVSQHGGIDLLRYLQSICTDEGKLFFPAICFDHVGVAGPFGYPDASDSWDSMWRRIHAPVLSKPWHRTAPSSTAGALLANVLVFQLFQALTSVGNVQRNAHQFYLLNLETLEGGWHSYFPYPGLNEFSKAERIDHLDERLTAANVPCGTEELFSYFGRLTEVRSGIFHLWDEGGLIQLPLAQCRVQPVNPLSDGPANLLPEVVCAGLTHEDARREAGFTGIEAYVQKMVPRLIATRSSIRVNGQPHTGDGAEGDEWIGVGAGRTVAEAVWRGLHNCLQHEFSRRLEQQQPIITPVRISSVEDETCSYYLEALRVLDANFVIGMGEDVLGFPVVWVGSGGRFVGSVGVTITAGLRRALEHVLMRAVESSQALSDNAITMAWAKQATTWTLGDESSQPLRVAAVRDIAGRQEIQAAIAVLERCGIQMVVYDVAVEPFLRDTLAGVFGVLLRQEESQ